MIAVTNILDIIFDKCVDFGISDVREAPKDILGPLKSEMIGIHAKSLVPGTYWKKGFVEVNLYVPDIDGEQDLIRLGQLERVSYSVFDELSGKFDGTGYRYSIYSTGIEENEPAQSHYVNVKLLFEVLNVRL